MQISLLFCSKCKLFWPFYHNKLLLLHAYYLILLYFLPHEAGQFYCFSINLIGSQPKKELFTRLSVLVMSDFDNLLYFNSLQLRTLCQMEVKLKNNLCSLIRSCNVCKYINGNLGFISSDRQAHEAWSWATLSEYVRMTIYEDTYQIVVYTL